MLDVNERKTKNKKFFLYTYAAEVNPACAKVLLRKTLVTPDLRRISDRRKKSTTKTVVLF